ncbi:hypothetical protein [Amycolatopsis kentuckyensis]|uniref:hypothetical protein n=1 Tax=Amycolatopsis kentuckyensis TaxID=218823 RepID=UPI001177EC8D|nr:hypothetical protein [Amycolatopsis kentuckyensis]
MKEPLIALEPGERLLWSGRPRRIAPTGLEWFRIVFGSFMVSAFAAAIGVSSLGAAVTFGIIGLAIVWGPVLWRLRRTRREVYAVTDQRVVVADRVSGHTRACEYLGDLESPVVRRDEDGGGRLTLTRRHGSVYLLGYSLPKQGEPAPIELFDVPDVDGLRDLIVQEQAAD